VKYFVFILAEEAHHAIALLCRVLQVSRSGYYAWRGRQPERGGAPSARARADGALLPDIRRIHTQSRGTYGSPRVHAELRGEGTRCGRKRVARLMRQAGLAGCHRRTRRPRTTVPDRQATPAPDRVERCFAPAQIGAPNKVWVADITYVPTGEGWLYLAAVLDAFSRHCSGWAMADHLRTELVLDAVELALARRRPAKDGGLVHHTPTMAASTRHLRSASAYRRRGSPPPWARSATATTTPSRRASSPPSRASCSTATTGPLARRLGRPSSST